MLRVGHAHGARVLEEAGCPHASTFFFPRAKKMGGWITSSYRAASPATNEARNPVAWGETPETLRDATARHAIRESTSSLDVLGSGSQK